MKTADDFRRALGEGDEGFHRRVQATLAALPEEEPVVKKKMSVGLAIAFALLMMTMVAAMAANWWGIGDFLKNDNLEGMTQGANVTAETEHATFTVTEHIYDGRGIYMVVAVRPKNEGTLLLPQGVETDSIIQMGVPEAGTMTVEEYAAKKGYTDFVWVAVNSELNLTGYRAPYLSPREHLEEDGTLLVMRRGVEQNLPREVYMPLLCGSNDTILYTDSYWQEKPRVSRARMDVTLKSNPADERHWRSAEPVVFDELGMTVDEVRMVQTILATYYEIDYTAHDPVTNQRDRGQLPGYHFQFVDDHGKSMTFRGPIGSMSYRILDKTAGRGRWFGALSPMNPMPEAINLKCYQGTNFTFYEAKQTLPIPLIPAE